MSIRKKQAEAIIGALMTDLAAAGELAALAVVRRASMSLNNEFAKYAQQNIGSLVTQVKQDIGRIRAMITSAKTTGAPANNVENALKHINALETEVDDQQFFDLALARAKKMASKDFIEGEVFNIATFGTEVDIELIFDEEWPTTERPQTEKYKEIINKIVTNLRHITDSQGAVSGEPQSASSDATRASAIAEYRKVAEEATAILKALSEPQKGEKSTALRNSPDWKEWIKVWEEIGERDSGKLSLSQIKNATTKGRSAFSVLNK